ncbi:MAG: inositol monophosphatase [Nanoarchaeota archaeon]|nr:inositol monophosphatase [Nanoarchaeota archaeon]
MPATYKGVALKAAKEAGKIQLKYYKGKFAKQQKKDKSFVTKADLESTKAVRRIISGAFPEHNILCEELGGSNKNSDYRWIIDPLDGTHNFIMHNPLFGVSIALEYKKEIILGVIYMPVLEKLCWAEKGKGSYCNGKRISVSRDKDLKKCMVCFDSDFKRESTKKIKMVRNLSKRVWGIRAWGVAIYNNLLVAEGKAGVCIDFGSNPWDHSAALLMIEEAGGKVTDLKGDRWTTEIEDYVATNGKVHSKVLNVIKK